MKIAIDSILYDKKGVQILPNDLLKVYHFFNKRKHYMYHVACKDDNGHWRGRCYNDMEPHYYLNSSADDNGQILNAEIINRFDWETKRLKIK